jgi:hypothetical protein
MKKARHRQKTDARRLHVWLISEIRKPNKKRRQIFAQTKKKYYFCTLIP